MILDQCWKFDCSLSDYFLHFLGINYQFFWGFILIINWNNLDYYPCFQFFSSFFLKKYKKEIFFTDLSKLKLPAKLAN